ncbi:hypothetical protein [Rhizobium sp. Root1203]|uniref:hypothetical protein n=1 Tax=Rhizobium sp. Root1203 TaxID=1736427 RepID=UPI0012E3E154|nr:hypothetical protein [Rhizobium sp. Root1203]
MTLQTIIEKLQQLRSRQRTHATRTWVRKHLARLPAHLADDLGVQTWESWGDASSHQPASERDRIETTSRFIGVTTRAYCCS